MVRNYFAIAIRKIRQSPLYAFINIFSLAIGLAACMVIYLFIRDERSFDAFHTKNPSIYRLDEVQNFTGTNLQKVALTMPGMGPSMVADYPEVVTFTRFRDLGKTLFKLGEKQVLLDLTRAVDSTFLDIFDFRLLVGDASTALDDPHTMIITEETALKFFDNAEAALGNSLNRCQ